MGFRSGMLAGQSSTIISWSANHLEVVLVLWAGAKVLLEKETSISIKSVSRWKHKVLQNLLVEGCFDIGLDKTQQTSQYPKSSLTSETSHWTSSSLDSVPLQSSSRLQTKCTFIWKEDFGPMSNSPGVSFIKLSVDFIQKVYVCTKARFCVRVHFFQIYKTMHTPEPAHKLLYKSQSGEDCVYVHLHPDSSQKSPYMELTTPSFTMHNLIFISFPCTFPPTWHMFNTVKGTRR